MKRILLAGATLLALTSAQPTLAADAPVYRKGPAPAAAAVFNWSGLYLGLQAGYGWGNYTFDYNAPDVGSNSKGWLIGGTLGWNWQAPGSNIVLGLEGDLAWADIKGSASCPNPAFDCRSKLDAFGTIRGRVGVAMAASLWYITGGWAFANQRSETVDNVPPFPATGQINGTAVWVNGWTLGGGFEWAFAPNWSAKLEYLHYNLGTANHTIDGGQVITTKSAGNIVRGGVNWRF